MEKRCPKTPLNLCFDWLTCTFSQNRPPCISIHAGFRDFRQKFTRGFCVFSDPLVNVPFKPNRGAG
jgi:hypothetical protein